MALSPASSCLPKYTSSYSLEFVYVPWLPTFSDESDFGEKPQPRFTRGRFEAYMGSTFTFIIWLRCPLNQNLSRNFFGAKSRGKKTVNVASQIKIDQLEARILAWDFLARLRLMSTLASSMFWSRVYVTGRDVRLMTTAVQNKDTRDYPPSHLDRWLVGTASRFSQ